MMQKISTYIFNVSDVGRPKNRPLNILDDEFTYWLLMGVYTFQ